MKSQKSIQVMYKEIKTRRDRVGIKPIPVEDSEEMINQIWVDALAWVLEVDSFDKKKIEEMRRKVWAELKASKAAQKTPIAMNEVA